MPDNIEGTSRYIFGGVGQLQKEIYPGTGGLALLKKSVSCSFMIAKDKIGRHSGRLGVCPRLFTCTFFDLCIQIIT